VSVAGCNKKRGWIRMENSVFWLERNGNLKVEAECEYLRECGFCVWAVERRMRNKWVSQD